MILFFGRERILELEALGTVEWNEGCEQFSQEELCERIAGKDICVTGWGSPLFDEKVLAHADRLKLIAHTGGSVKPIVTDAVYERGIRVVSGNRVFAESVAEGVIAYALAALRDIPYYSAQVKAGFWRPKFENRGLLDRSVGIVGYGMTAENGGFAEKDETRRTADQYGARAYHQGKCAGEDSAGTGYPGGAGCIRYRTPSCRSSAPFLR